MARTLRLATVELRAGTAKSNSPWSTCNAAAGGLTSFAPLLGNGCEFPQNSPHPFGSVSYPRIGDRVRPVVRFGNVRLEWLNVSIDKSLKRKSRLARVRSVLTRPERIDQMKANEKWVEGSSPFGIPKTRVIRLVLGKKKKKKAADGADGAADKKKAAKKK